MASERAIRANSPEGALTQEVEHLLGARHNEAGLILQLGGYVSVEEAEYPGDIPRVYVGGDGRAEIAENIYRLLESNTPWDMKLTDERAVVVMSRGTAAFVA